MNDERFDRIVEQMRDETASPEQIEGARERVRRRLLGTDSLACDELRPALAEFARGGLEPDRRLLVKDHLARCVECRRALAEIKGERRGRVATLPSSGRRSRWVRWAVAASLLLVVAFVSRHGIDRALAPGGPRAVVETVSGTLVHLSQGVLQAGAELHDGDVVRTAGDSQAVLRLADGSALEMNGRTELDLQGAWSGDTVRLQRGDVVVQAAEQGYRRLRVMTRDSVATVRGTVFAVSAAAAGSLVSVVEGEVAVSQPGFERLLGAGQQAASNPALSSVSVQQAVSWSADADDYRTLLADLGAIESQFATMTGSALRTDARLLPYLPDGVIAYGAAPNVDGAIGEVLRMVEQRARPGTPLGDWWASEEGDAARAALAGLEGITSMLGEEIVLVLEVEGPDGEPSPLLLAEVPAGNSRALQDALAAVAAAADEPLAYRVNGSLLLVAASAAELARLEPELGLGAGSSFAMELAARYREGVAWLGAVDLSFHQSLLTKPDDRRAMRALGLDRARFLVVEQKTTDLGDLSLGTVSFDGRRSGVASWLAAPGPLGAAEYISSNAIVAGAAATREPQQAFEQLLRSLGDDSELADALRELERETGVRFQDDIVAALGTDFAFSIEQPTLPVPGWVAVVEVLDPASLDATMQRMVDAANASAGERELALERETVAGHTWRRMWSPSGDDFPGLEWTYHLGYLVASPDRALALGAIEARSAGRSLAESAAFEQSYPDGVGLHSSGFLWLNPERLSELGALLGEGGSSLVDAATREPVLMVTIGESDRVTGVTRSRLSGLFFDLALVDQSSSPN